MDIVDVAPKINVQRLIYIEINDFSTRPDPQVELFHADHDRVHQQVLTVIGGKG